MSHIESGKHYLLIAPLNRRLIEEPSREQAITGEYPPANGTSADLPAGLILSCIKVNTENVALFEVVKLPQENQSADWLISSLFTMKWKIWDLLAEIGQ